MDPIIVEESGSFLLIACQSRFAVIERRNGHLYNCHGGKRDGTAFADLSKATEILDETDWVAEAAARRAFQEVASEYANLAEHIR